MLQSLWGLQAIIIICLIILIAIICLLTDLPTMLGLTFSKKETIEKYIEKNLITKQKHEKTICTFRMIGSKKRDNIEEVYIYMCICKYIKENKKLKMIMETYKKGIVTINRQLGIYRVIGIQIDTDNANRFFPEEILKTDDYNECISSKERRFLKEANVKKAKKKFKLKKAFKV